MPQWRIVADVEDGPHTSYGHVELVSHGCQFGAILEVENRLRRKMRARAGRVSVRPRVIIRRITRVST